MGRWRQYHYLVFVAGLVFTFQNCGKSGVLNGELIENKTAPSTTIPDNSPAPTASTCSPNAILDPALFVSDGGMAIMIDIAAGTAADDDSSATQSTLRLFENGIEIGPAHALHADIRNLGMGRFSHWSAVAGGSQRLRFSASDNSDPRTNQKVYTYCDQ